MGLAEEGDEQGGCGFTDLGLDLLGGGPVGHVVRVVDVGDDPPHWGGVGWMYFTRARHNSDPGGRKPTLPQVPPV